MSYLVIARKYRPSTFDNLVGQKAVVTTLKNAIKFNRVAHAYLFSGPRGVGKTSMARILSKALNCETGVSESPCNKCDICISISNGNDVDVLEIDGASNRGIDEIRNIRQNVNYIPTRARYKIYIIDEVHMLTKEAFNALLKTLEEPPSHVKFIFATTSANKLPETVQSRCQRFDFKNISQNEIIDQISLICKKEGIKAEKDVFRFIASYAKGGLRDALSILDQLISFSDKKISLNDVHAILGTIDDELMFKLTDNILKQDLKNTVKNLKEVFDKGKGVTEFIDQIIWYLRDLLMALIFENEPKKNETLSTYQLNLLANHKGLSIDMLTYMIQVLSEVRRKARDDRHKRILLEVAIIKLARTEEISAIDDLLNRIESIEKNLLIFSNNKCLDSTNKDESIDSNKKKPYSKVNSNVNSDENNRIDTPDSKLETITTDVKPKGITEDSKDLNDDKNEVNDDKESIWNNILDKVQSKKKSLGAMLREGKLVDYKNRQISVEFPNNFRFLKEQLEKPDTKNLIEELAETIVGEKIKLRLVLSEKAREKVVKKESFGNKNGINGETSDIVSDAINDGLPTDDSDIINNDCIKKAVEIFDGRIVDIRRIEK